MTSAVNEDCQTHEIVDYRSKWRARFSLQLSLVEHPEAGISICMKMTHILTNRDYPHNSRFRSKSAVELGGHEKTKDGISKTELDKIRSLSRQSWKCSWEDPGNPLPGVKSNHFVTTYSTTHNYKALRELTPCRPTSPTRRNNPHPTRFAKILFCLKCLCEFTLLRFIAQEVIRCCMLLTNFTKFESAWRTIRQLRLKIIPVLSSLPRSHKRSFENVDISLVTVANIVVCLLEANGDSNLDFGHPR